MDTKSIGKNKAVLDFDYNEVFSGLCSDHYSEAIPNKSKGIRGLLRSPYVFGACVLAASGGFSFGYGIYTPMYTTQEISTNCSTRPRCYISPRVLLLVNNIDYKWLGPWSSQGCM